MLLESFKTHVLLLVSAIAILGQSQQEILGTLQSDHNVSDGLFRDLEELSRVVDIAYCVGTAGLGIQKPFLCASRCQDFKHFELVKVSSCRIIHRDALMR